MFNLLLLWESRRTVVILAAWDKTYWRNAIVDMCKKCYVTLICWQNLQEIHFFHFHWILLYFCPTPHARIFPLLPSWSTFNKYIPSLFFPMVYRLFKGVGESLKVNESTPDHQLLYPASTITLSQQRLSVLTGREFSSKKFRERGVDFVQRNFPELINIKKIEKSITLELYVPLKRNIKGSPFH